MTHGQKTALAIGLTAIAMLFVLVAASAAYAGDKPPVVTDSQCKPDPNSDADICLITYEDGKKETYRCGVDVLVETGGVTSCEKVK